jgi:hypothetical protein
MRLTDLDPQFVRFEERHAPDPQEWEDGVLRAAGSTYQVQIRVDSIQEAQGIRFACPKCYIANNGLVGTHGVLCWSSSRGVPDHATPGPGRWSLQGTGYNDLTLGEEPGKSRSVLLHGECKEPDGKMGPGWHGFVTNGDVT